MDFRSINVGAKPSEVRADAIHDFTPIDPGSEDGKPFLNGADKPLVLQLADPSSPRARREMVKLRIKYPPAAEPKDGWTEAGLNEAAEDEEGRQREMLARFVVGWNLEHDGKAVPFAVEHAAEFFEVFPSVAGVTMIEIARLMDASGNGESGSAGGPRKTDGSDESTRKPAKAGGKR